MTNKINKCEDCAFIARRFFIGKKIHGCTFLLRTTKLWILIKDLFKTEHQAKLYKYWCNPRIVPVNIVRAKRNICPLYKIMKKTKVLYHKNNHGIITIVELHTNWPIAYGLIRAHACARCLSKMVEGDKTVQVTQVDMRPIFRNIPHCKKTIDYYCASCANVWEGN